MVAPGGTLITISGSGGPWSLYASEVEYEFLTEPFERPEFSNAKLRSAPTATGALPLIVTSFGGNPLQLASTCTGDTPRPLNPDDDNINSIKQQFNIERYTISGAATLATDVDGMFTISKDQIKRLSRFQLHLEKASMELSYGALVNMQSQTFSYLTTTGLTATGTSLGGSVSDILVISFSPGVLYTITSSGALIKDWKLVFDKRTITNRLGS